MMAELLKRGPSFIARFGIPSDAPPVIAELRLAEAPVSAGASSWSQRMAYYWLTPPSRAIFFLSVLLAVLALLVRYAHVAIPLVSQYTFETLLLAFVLLLAGNMFRGL